jgi:hypothetical protein
MRGIVRCAKTVGQILVMATSLIGLACHEATAPARPVDRDAAGNWTEDPGSAGELFMAQMTETSGEIAGSGAIFDPANPAGAEVILAGTVVNDTLVLKVVVYPGSTTPQPAGTPGDTAVLIGVLSTMNRIDGTLTRDGSSRTIRLFRIVPATSCPMGAFCVGVVLHN